MDRSEQQALISQLEASPAFAPAWEPTLREVIADLMEDIYRCPAKQEKMQMVALEYRARLILQRLRLREAN